MWFTAPDMNIWVCWSGSPRRVEQQKLTLTEGSTVQHVLDMLTHDMEGYNETWGLSLWGRRVQGTEVLREGDRLEITRGLLVDPKVARRERFASQGVKTAGLFSRKRAGSKPGY